jgi:hypothetical protein
MCPFSASVKRGNRTHTQPAGKSGAPIAAEHATIELPHALHFSTAEVAERRRDRREEPLFLVLLDSGVLLPLSHSLKKHRIDGKILKDTRVS